MQLNNTLTSTSTTQALTAAQGKALNDKLVSGSTSQAGLVQLNNTLTSTSTTQALTAAQGKALNDKLPKYGVCSTTAATAAKTVSITGFVLATGSMVTVKFTYGNTASYPTLNVNGTGAKTVYRDASSYYPMDLAANDVVSFVYDGSYFRMLDIPDASTTRAGKVQLSNTLTSTSTTMALTAAQGKALNDKMLNITAGTFTLKTQNGANSRECSYYKLGPLVTIYGQLNNYDGTSAYLSGLPFKPVKSSSTLCEPMIADEYYMVTAATNGYLYMYDPSVHSYNTVSNQWKGQQFTITYVTAS